MVQKLFQEYQWHATILSTEHTILFTGLQITVMTVTTIPNITGMYFVAKYRVRKHNINFTRHLEKLW